MYIQPRVVTGGRMGCPHTDIYKLPNVLKLMQCFNLRFVFTPFFLSLCRQLVFFLTILMLSYWEQSLLKEQKQQWNDPTRTTILCAEDLHWSLIIMNMGSVVHFELTPHTPSCCCTTASNEQKIVPRKCTHVLVVSQYLTIRDLAGYQSSGDFYMQSSCLNCSM